MDFYKKLSPVPCLATAGERDRGEGRGREEGGRGRDWGGKVEGGSGADGPGRDGGRCRGAAQGRDLPSSSWLSSNRSRLRMSWKKISSTVFSRRLNSSEMLEMDMLPRSVM